VHFDPVGSEETSKTDIREFIKDDVLTRQAREGSRAEVDRRAHAVDDIDEEDDEEGREQDEEPAPRAREGLPARFRMRHTPHYVEELLGDAPPRTVREIPIAEIEPPIDDSATLDDLELSIRRLGVIEPLLVGRRGAIYRVIAGMRRLRAAERAGLETVPCIVHDIDEARWRDMRDAASQRLTVPTPAVEFEDSESTSTQPAVEPTIGEAALDLEFVAALLPAMNAAGRDRLRWGVLSDLAAVELSRTKQLAAAEELLRSGSAVDRASVDHVALVSAAASAVATEARLRGVRVELAAPGSDREIFLDGGRCRDAITGLLQSLLALAPRGGTELDVSAQITAIRPALIVECRLHDSDPDLSPEALIRFFDGGWREHPCGVNCGQMLAALAQTARLHGGRVGVKAAGRGCLVTFVVPRLEG
jgi:hypothetical protein